MERRCCGARWSYSAPGLELPGQRPPWVPLPVQASLQFGEAGRVAELPLERDEARSEDRTRFGSSWPPLD